MMNKRKSPIQFSAKYLLCAPLVALLLLSNAAKASNGLSSISSEISDIVASITISGDSLSAKADMNGNVDGEDLKATVVFVPPVIAKKDSDDKSEDKTYTTVEVMPEYVGGMNAMFEYISSNLKYPASAAKNSAQGRVIIRFVVDKTGKVKDPVVLRGFHVDCDAEALRVVANMPDWKPGMQGGKAVGVYFTLPVVFKMKPKVPEEKVIVDEAKKTENVE